MGYESKLLIVQKSRYSSICDNMFYGNCIAAFKLSKVGDRVHSAIMAYPDSSVYTYADDGNTVITEDLYGNKLKEIPLKDMINILKEELRLYSYRRFETCLKMLEAFDSDKWEDVVVLHCGY